MVINFLNILWMLVSIFMILVILLQRGRGGGLTGALGGVGGSSAFGTKAGDVFTKITVGVFAVWLLLALLLVPLMSKQSPFEGGAEASGEAGVVAQPGEGAGQFEEPAPGDAETDTTPAPPESPLLGTDPTQIPPVPESIPTPKAEAGVPESKPEAEPKSSKEAEPAEPEKAENDQ